MKAALVITCISMHTSHLIFVHLLVVATTIQLLLNRLQLVRILGLAHRLVHMIENAPRQVQRPADGLRLSLVIRIHFQRDRVQALEQQRILGQALQRGGQQILQLQPSARLVRFGFGQEAMQIVVLATFLLQRLQGDLLASAKVRGVLLQLVAGAATKHGQQQVADGRNERVLFEASLLQLLLEVAVVIAQREQSGRKQQIEVFGIEGATLLQWPIEDTLEQLQRTHVIALRLVDLCWRGRKMRNLAFDCTQMGLQTSRNVPLIISWRSFSALDKFCSTSDDTFELQSASGSASSSLCIHSRVIDVEPTVVDTCAETTSIETVGLCNRIAVISVSNGKSISASRKPTLTKD